MNDKFTKYLPLLMLAGLVLGAVFGLLLPEFSMAIGFVGRLFMGILRFVVVPLLVAGAVTGLALLTEGRSTGRVSLVFFSYVLATTLAGVVLAVIMSLIFAPAYRFAGLPVGPLTTTWQSVSDALGDMIPANPLRAVAEGKYFGLVLLGAFLGAGLVALGVRGRSVLSLFRGLHDGLLKVVQVVLYAAPVGLFSLVAAAVAQQKGSFADWMATSGGYLGVSLLTLAVHGAIILPLIVWYAGGRSPWQFYSDLSTAFLTALGTGSKAVTFPVTMQCLNDRARLDSRATAGVLPLGTVLNLSGNAIVMVVGSLFIAQAFGAGLGLGSILALSLLAVILSFGAAGLPSSMLLAAPVLFGAVGLTPEQMALAIPAILAFDWLVDRAAAVINVGSDAVAAAVIAETLGVSGVRRPSRPRRTGREEGEFERRGRRPQIARTSDSRPAFVGPERGQPGPRERGRTEFRPGGRPPAAGDRSRPRPDTSEPSPFQMRTGRTSAFGSGTVAPAQETERPDTGRDRPERRERRPAHESPGDRRRSSGQPRVRTDRPEAEHRTPHPPAEPQDIPEVAVDTEAKRVSREAVARDLARISAQLGKSGESEAAEENRPRTEPANVGEPPADFPDVRSVEGESPRGEDTLVDDAVVSQSERADWDDVIDTPDAPESDDAITEGETEAGDSETPTAYGRRRAFRGAAFRRDDKAPESEPKEPLIDDRPQGFSADDVSFGRAKRKKPRR